MSDPLAQLERQVERASLFTHTALGRDALRLDEVEAFLYGLVDVLLSKGVVSSDELSAAAARIREEKAGRGEVPGPGVAVTVEAEDAARETLHVDCEARWPVCHGICCKLDFALTVAEIESAKIRWDLGRPYFIRHEAGGRCSHSDPETGRCRIYPDRPGICRTYSCAADGRICKNFERMELNTEWLEENLSDSAPRLVHALMCRREDDDA